MEGFIRWSDEWKSWGVYVVDENFQYIAEPEYFAFKSEAKNLMKEINERHSGVKWEIGTRG